MKLTPAEKAAKKAAKKAKKRARRKVLGRIFNVVRPLAERAVLSAAKEAGLDGEGRSAFAVAQLSRLLDAAIVLPQPWEAISDAAIKGLGAVLAGAVENAYRRLQEQEAARAGGPGYAGYLPGVDG